METNTKTPHGKPSIYLTRLNLKPPPTLFNFTVPIASPNQTWKPISISIFIHPRCKWLRFRSIPTNYRKNKNKGKEKAKGEWECSIQSHVRKSCGFLRPTLVSRREIGDGEEVYEKGDLSKSKEKGGVVREDYTLSQPNHPVSAPAFPKSIRRIDGGLRQASWVLEVGFGYSQKRRIEKAKVWMKKRMNASSLVRGVLNQMEVKGDGVKLPLSEVLYGGTIQRVVRQGMSVKRRVAHCKCVHLSLAYLNSSWINITNCTFLSSSVCWFKIECNCVYECILVLYLVENRNLFFIFDSIPKMNIEKSMDKRDGASEAHASKGKSSSPLDQNVGPKSQCTPHNDNIILNEKLGVENGQNQIRVESLDAQLDKIRIESSKTKNKSLMGYVFGDPIDFKTMKFRLLSTWRLIRGEVQIYDRGHGWFECVFRELYHLQKIWGGRPYHVKGQLLLLKPWRVDFNTKNEDTNVLDLWIRIFNLPPPLACNDGVRLILEENGVGKFIKFDRASGGFFARACVNINIIKNVPGQVRMSDNKDHPLLLVWFEDFPHGCGNCGELRHVYKNCPLKQHIPKKISINIIRNNSPTCPNPVVSDPNLSSSQNEKQEGWTTVQKLKKKNAKSGEGPSQGVKPYIEGGQAVTVSFISKEAALPPNPQCDLGSENQERMSLSKEREEADPIQTNDEMECDGVAHVILSPAEDGSKAGAHAEVEYLMEEDDLIGEDLEAIEKQEKYITELEKEMLAAAVESSASGQFYSPQDDEHEPTPQAEVGSHNSNSDSLKRKGDVEGSEDTASFSLKRKKPSGFP